MSTPTPRTQALYLKHANYCDQDAADEAVEDFRDLARTLERELSAERQKVRALTAILESICEEWGRNHDANPIGAGQRMETMASKMLEKLEEDSENA